MLNHTQWLESVGEPPLVDPPSPNSISLSLWSIGLFCTQPSHCLACSLLSTEYSAPNQKDSELIHAKLPLVQNFRNAPSQSWFKPNYLEFVPLRSTLRLKLIIFLKISWQVIAMRTIPCPFAFREVFQQFYVFPWVRAACILLGSTINNIWYPKKLSWWEINKSH